jgi:hypothetical protein
MYHYSDNTQLFNKKITSNIKKNREPFRFPVSDFLKAILFLFQRDFLCM